MNKAHENIEYLINRDIIDSMPCFIYWKDKNSNYLGCNKPYAEKMGVDPGDVIGLTDSELDVISDGTFVTDAALAQICVQTDVGTYKAEFSIGEGDNERWFSARRININNSGEEGLSVVGMIFDITDKEKTDFLSRISHELCTPLNAIISMAHFSKSEDNIEKIKSNISIIHKASTQLMDTINDVLIMSRIELGQVSLARLPFELKKMLLETCSAFMPNINEKEQALRFHIARNVPLKFRGDEFRLSQVITNMLKIATKLAPVGGEIEININAIEPVAEKSIIEFSVVSTGKGQANESKAYINNVAEQLNTGEYRHYGETGLVITICKKIVEMMGGAIRIEAVEGGSALEFTVPMDVITAENKLPDAVNNECKDRRVLYYANEEGQKGNVRDYIADKEQSDRFEKYRQFIDIDEGLSRIGGNKKLFSTMLKNFIDGVAFADLKKSVTENNLSAIQRDYGMLKSVTATLSLTKLQKSLILVENQLISQNSQEKALSTIEELLLETNHKIAELLTEWE